MKRLPPSCLPLGVLLGGTCDAALVAPSAPLGGVVGEQHGVRELPSFMQTQVASLSKSSIGQQQQAGRVDEQRSQQSKQEQSPGAVAAAFGGWDGGPFPPGGGPAGAVNSPPSAASIARALGAGSGALTATTGGNGQMMPAPPPPSGQGPAAAAPKPAAQGGDDYVATLAAPKEDASGMLYVAAVNSAGPLSNPDNVKKAAEENEKLLTKYKEGGAAGANFAEAGVNAMKGVMDTFEEMIAQKKKSDEALAQMTNSIKEMVNCESEEIEKAVAVSNTPGGATTPAPPASGGLAPVRPAPDPAMRPVGTAPMTQAPLPVSTPQDEGGSAPALLVANRQPEPAPPVSIAAVNSFPSASSGPEGSSDNFHPAVTLSLSETDRRTTTTGSEGFSPQQAVGASTAGGPPSPSSFAVSAARTSCDYEPMELGFCRSNAGPAQAQSAELLAPNFAQCSYADTLSGCQKQCDANPNCKALDHSAISAVCCQYKTNSVAGNQSREKNVGCARKKDANCIVGTVAAGVGGSAPVQPVASNGLPPAVLPGLQPVVGGAGSARAFLNALQMSENLQTGGRLGDAHDEGRRKEQPGSSLSLSETSRATSEGTTSTTSSSSATASAMERLTAQANKEKVELRSAQTRYEQELRDNVLLQEQQKKQLARARTEAREAMARLEQESKQNIAKLEQDLEQQKAQARLLAAQQASEKNTLELLNGGAAGGASGVSNTGATGVALAGPTAADPNRATIIYGGKSMSVEVDRVLQALLESREQEGDGTVGNLEQPYSETSSDEFRPAPLQLAEVGRRETGQSQNSEEQKQQLMKHSDGRYALAHHDTCHSERHEKAVETRTACLGDVMTPRHVLEAAVSLADAPAGCNWFGKGGRLVVFWNDRPLRVAAADQAAASETSIIPPKVSSDEAEAKKLADSFGGRVCAVATGEDSGVPRTTGLVERGKDLKEKKDAEGAALLQLVERTSKKMQLPVEEPTSFSAPAASATALNGRTRTVAAPDAIPAAPPVVVYPM